MGSAPFIQYNKPPTSKLFVVSTMSQLAQYVYQDYHCRMDALRAQRREAQVDDCFSASSY